MFSGVWAGGVKMYYGGEVVKKSWNLPKPKEKIQKLDLGPKRYCKICQTSVGSSEKDVVSGDEITFQSHCLFQSLANIGITNGLEKPLTPETVKEFFGTKFVDSSLPPFENMEKILTGLYELQEKIFGPLDFDALCNQLRSLPQFKALAIPPEQQPA
jgi:hypothetical protein